MNIVFICGTGRSGTSVTASWFGEFDNVSRVPLESRFIIDPDGIRGVYDAFTGSNALDQRDIAILRFKTLMQSYTSSFLAPYVGYDLDRIIGKKNMVSYCVDDLVRALTVGSFQGSDKLSGTNTYIEIVHRFILGLVGKLRGQSLRSALKPSVRPRDIHIPSSVTHEELVAACVNCAREVLFALAGCSQVDRSSGLLIEASPHNLFHVEFLRMLFPSSQFLLLKRNPLGLCFSLRDKIWSPNSDEQIAEYVRHLTQESITVERKINSGELAGSVAPIESFHLESEQARIAQKFKLHGSPESGIKIKESANSWWLRPEFLDARIKFVALLGEQIIKEAGYQTT
jgi:hypothetical protein